jgi:hypothetical protein
MYVCILITYVCIHTHHVCMYAYSSRMYVCTLITYVCMHTHHVCMYPYSSRMYVCILITYVCIHTHHVCMYPYSSRMYVLSKYDVYVSILITYVCIHTYTSYTCMNAQIKRQRKPRSVVQRKLPPHMTCILLLQKSRGVWSSASFLTYVRRLACYQQCLHTYTPICIPKNKKYLWVPSARAFLYTCALHLRYTHAHCVLCAQGQLCI